MYHQKLLSMKEGLGSTDVQERILELLNRSPFAHDSWKDLTDEGHLIQEHSLYISRMSMKKGEDDLRALSYIGDMPRLFLYLPHASVWLSLTKVHMVAQCDSKRGMFMHVFPELAHFAEEPLVHMYYYEPCAHVDMYRSGRSLYEFIRKKHVTPLKAMQLHEISLFLMQLIPVREILMEYLYEVDHNVGKNIVFNTVNFDGKLKLQVLPHTDRTRLFSFLSNMSNSFSVSDPVSFDVPALIASVMKQQTELFSRLFPSFSLQYELLAGEHPYARLLN